MAKAKKAKKALVKAPRGATGNTPPTQDRRLKKIYVHSQGTFVLHNASEVRKLVIATPAFDLGGWMDLSKMAPGGDRVFIEVRASFANRVNVLYRNMVFEGPTLVTVADLVNGNNPSGTHIEFWVKQTQSSNNFATPVEFAYQFIVESQ